MFAVCTKLFLVTGECFRSVNKRVSPSGRSSASSYVAQLREKKRAGARLNAQTKPGDCVTEIIWNRVLILLN